MEYKPAHILRLEFDDIILSEIDYESSGADGMLSVCSQRNRQIRSRNLFTAIGKTVGH